MRLLRLGVTMGGLLAATLSAPILLAETNTRTPPPPGTVNYVEGQASIGGQILDSKSVGSTALLQGETLNTGEGKVEILLTPGVFLRIGDNSRVKMVTPDLANTEVHLEKGDAMIEVSEIHPENDIRIIAGDATARLLKTGLYDVNLNEAEFRVFEGKAEVVESDKQATVDGGRAIGLSGTEKGKLKANKFKKKDYYEGDLYRWSSLRSSYLAEANVDAAALYADNGGGPWGSGWWGADWYWDPYYDAFTFIPGDGIFYSPFGWGFYSPWMVYQSPFYGYGGYGSGYRPFYHHFGPDYHTWGGNRHYVGSPGYSHGIYNGAGSVGAFNSGPRMMMDRGRSFARAGNPGIRSGGFGGGGFHGGGFGGGFHGGGFHGGVGFHGGGGFHGR